MLILGNLVKINFTAKMAAINIKGVIVAVYWYHIWCMGLNPLKRFMDKSGSAKISKGNASRDKNPSG